ncbi:MAG: hypothetical protein QG673_48 [Pseudomonadota bacterium]|nr:hypothetical protein [Pseudomonadota bacterium]
MLSRLSRISPTTSRYNTTTTTTTTTTPTTTNNPISATNTSHSPVNNEEAENNYQQQLQETLSQIKNDFSSEIQQNWNNNDIGMAYNEIFTALEKHNFVDAINLFQQHSNMHTGTTGFMPRGRYQNFIKLLVSLLPYSKHTESYTNNVKHVFKACVLDLISAGALKLIIGMVKDVPEVWNETIVMKKKNSDEQISTTIDNIEGLLFLKNNCEQFFIRRVNALIILKLTFDSIQYSNTRLPQEQQNITGINTQPLLDFASKYGADWNDDPDHSLINKEFIDQCTNLFDNPQHKVQLLVCYNQLTEFGLLTHYQKTLEKNFLGALTVPEAQTIFANFGLAKLLSLHNNATQQKTLFEISVRLQSAIRNHLKSQASVPTEIDGLNNTLLITLFCNCGLSRERIICHLPHLNVEQFTFLFQNEQFINAFRCAIYNDTTEQTKGSLTPKDFNEIIKTAITKICEYHKMNNKQITINNYAELAIFNFIKFDSTMFRFGERIPTPFRNILQNTKHVSTDAVTIADLDKTNFASSATRKTLRDTVITNITSLIEKLRAAKSTQPGEYSDPIIDDAIDILSNFSKIFELMKIQENPMKTMLSKKSGKRDIIDKCIPTIAKKYSELVKKINQKSDITDTDKFVCYCISKAFSDVFAPGSPFNFRFLLKHDSELFEPTLSLVTGKKLLGYKIPLNDGLQHTICLAYWYSTMNTAEGKTPDLLHQTIFKSMIPDNERKLNTHLAYVRARTNHLLGSVFTPLAVLLGLTTDHIPVDISNILHVLFQAPDLSFEEFQNAISGQQSGIVETTTTTTTTTTTGSSSSTGVGSA